MQKHLFSLIFQFIPESTVMAFIIVVFLKKKPVLRKLLLIGLINGVLVYIFRLLPLTLGFHSILSLFTFTIMIIFLFKSSFLQTFISTLKCYILLTIVEIIFLNSILFITDISMEKLFTDLVLRTFIVLTQNLLLFVIGLFIYKRRHTLR